MGQMDGRRRLPRAAVGLCPCAPLPRPAAPLAHLLHASLAFVVYQSFKKEEQKSSLILPPRNTLLTVLFAGLFLFT